MGKAPAECKRPMLELLLDSILKGTTDLETLSKSHGLSEQALLGLLRNLRGIEIESGSVKVVNKLDLAISAMELGVAPRVASRHLSWREFEEEVSKVAELHGYTVFSNVSFLSSGRKWQVDVVAFTQTKALVIDCKHWGKTSRGALMKAAQVHLERTLSILKTPKLAGLARRGGFRRGLVLPILVTLQSSARGVFGPVFVVPIVTFNDFIANIDIYAESGEKISFAL